VATVRPFEADDHAAQGALSTSGLTDDAEHLAGFDRKRDVVDSAPGGVRAARSSTAKTELHRQPLHDEALPPEGRIHPDGTGA
jgi:hypothetical protein